MDGLQSKQDEEYLRWYYIHVLTNRYYTKLFHQTNILWSTAALQTLISTTLQFTGLISRLFEDTQRNRAAAMQWRVWRANMNGKYVIGSDDTIISYNE